MNGTRAATKVGRLDGVVSLGRVQTPTLALIVRRDLEIDAFVPETYFQVDARFELDESRTYVGRWFEGREDRTPERERAEAVAAAAGGAPTRPCVSVKRKERKERPPLLYDLTSLQREANRRFGMSAAPHAGRRPAALRGLVERRRHHLPANAHRSSCPPTRSRRSSRSPAAGRHPRLPAARRVRRRAGRAAAGARRQRRQGRRPPRDHPHRRAAARRAVRRRPAASTTWSPAGSWPCSTPTPGSRTPRSSPRPAARASAPRASGCWRPAGARPRSATRPAHRPRSATTRTSPSRRCRGSTRASPAAAPRPRCSRSRPSRRAATPRPRCWARWRRPAARSTTRSCARR